MELWLNFKFYFLLLLYRRVIGICILTWYPATLPHSFINSSNFLVVCLRFFVYIPCHLQTVTVLLLPFHSGFHSFLSLLWFLWLRLPVLRWVKVARVGILVLFLILEEMVSAFHYWLCCYLWLCHIYPLLCWGMFPLSLLSREFFNHKWMLNFVKNLYMSIEMIIYFLVFNLVMWCITWIDLCILKNPCIPGINPTWSWCMILLMCCWIVC